MIPHSNDIVDSRDLYVKFDMTNTTINMVQDLIASSGKYLDQDLSIPQLLYSNFHEKIKIPPVSTAAAIFPSTIFLDCNSNYNRWNFHGTATTTSSTTLLQPHHLVPVVDLTMPNDINDRHINTKS